nr:hypothetical protein BaRGS_010748 [Batillaria attramentaria]
MGHQPGRGNEEADRLAKSGSRKEQPQQAVSYTEAKTLVEMGDLHELEDMANVEAIVNAHHSSSNDGNINTRMETQGNSINAGSDDLWPNRSEGHSPCDQTCYGSTGSFSCQGSTSRLFTPAMEDALRRRLKFFFMDPCNKFRARRHWPWKLSLQLIKVVIITVQLVIFGGQRSDIVEYFERHDTALKHLLLKGWDPSYETMPYPPATGRYAIYSKDDFFDAIEYAWKGYYLLPYNSLASVTMIRENRTNNGVFNGTVLPVTLCSRFTNYETLDNGSYVILPGTINKCSELIPQQKGNETDYNIRTFFHDNNYTISFSRMLDVTLEFSFLTFHLNLIETHYGPVCYKVNTTIKFSNYERSGQLLVTLKNVMMERTCAGRMMSPGAADEEKTVKAKNVAYDVVVMLICIFSCILCVRSMLRAWQLKRKTDKFFKLRFGKGLDLSDHLEFVNFWYLLIIVNDVFTIVGTAYKIQLETREFTMTYNNYDVCSLFLGLGGLMAWIGCLRYLGFFKKYNILILTLKTAFPNVLRFSVCALAMYFGFMFCGWVILGPYHIKFRHLSSTSECLYSLVNGDDMFVTFSATQTDNLMVWYFSQVYLYVFISLFIYCVLSLFISVIMDTYETLKA